MKKRKHWERIIAIVLAVIMVSGVAPLDTLADFSWSPMIESKSFSRTVDVINRGLETFKCISGWFADYLNSLLFQALAVEYSNGLYTYTLSNDQATITKCDASVSGAITIPSSLDGNTVVAIGNNAFSNCTGITSITIKDHVQTVGYSAFSNCTSLSTVIMPESSYVLNGEAFKGCTALNNIDLGGITSLGYLIFLDCTSLNSLVIPNTVTKAEHISGVPRTIYGINRSVDMGALTGSYIENLTFESGIQSIPSYICSYCKTLRNVSIPDRELLTDLGAGITDAYSIGAYAFSNCDLLSRIDFPEHLTEIGNGAFSGCVALTSITIKDHVQTVGYSAFSNCTSLSTVIMPESSYVLNGEAFKGCTALNNIDLGGITSLGYLIFLDCTSLNSLVIPNTVTKAEHISGVPRTIYGINRSVDMGALTGSYIENLTFESGIQSIPSYFLSYCQTLQIVFMPNSITEIKPGGFFNCTSLTDVYFSGSETNWAAILIGQSNECLSSASVSIHYHCPSDHSDYLGTVWLDEPDRFDFHDEQFIMNNGVPLVDINKEFSIRNVTLYTESKTWNNRIKYTIEGPEGGIIPNGEITMTNKSEVDDDDDIQQWFEYKFIIPLYSKAVGEYTIRFIPTYGLETKEIQIQVVDYEYCADIVNPSYQRYSFDNKDTEFEFPIHAALFGPAKGWTLYRSREKARANGVCFGMSLTTALFARYPQMTTMFEEKQWQTDLRPETWSSIYNMDVGTWIKAAQITQFALEKHTVIKDIKSIYSLVVASNSPIPIRACNVGNKNAHCMLALGVVYGLDDCRNIVIYDPNSSKSSFLLKISKDYSSWALNASTFSYLSSDGDLIDAFPPEALDELYAYRFVFVDNVWSDMEHINYLSEHNLLIQSSTPLDRKQYLNSLDLYAYGNGNTRANEETTDYLYWADNDLHSLSLSAKEEVFISVVDIHSGISANLAANETATVTVNDAAQNSFRSNNQSGDVVQVSFMNYTDEGVMEVQIDGIANGGETEMICDNDCINVNGLSTGTICLRNDDDTIVSKKFVNGLGGRVQVFFDDEQFEIQYEDKLKIISMDGSFEQKVNWWRKYSSASMKCGFLISNCKKAVRYVWTSNSSRVSVDQNGLITNSGCFARSARITLTAYDLHDNVVTSSNVTVRFYKFDWQKTRLQSQEVVGDNFFYPKVKPTEREPELLLSMISALLEKKHWWFVSYN